MKRSIASAHFRSRFTQGSGVAILRAEQAMMKASRTGLRLFEARVSG